MKTYVFRVVVEPDEDRWIAYSPALKDVGGASWGHSADEALANVREVIEMTISSMQEHGESIPEDPESDVRVFSEPQVAVNL